VYYVLFYEESDSFIVAGKWSNFHGAKGWTVLESQKIFVVRDTELWKDNKTSCRRRCVGVAGK
jgi:hypothetical protein